MLLKLSFPFVSQCLLLALCLASPSSQAQNFPSKPITVVVPFAAGGSGDLVARTVADQLRERLKNPVLVDYRPGANTLIGTHFVQKAAPDGYTLLVSGSSFVTGAAIDPNAQYHPLNDFVPITEAVSVPQLVVVRNQFPAKDIAEFVAYARKNPGRVTFGSSGMGNVLQLATFKRALGLEIELIQYKGAAQAITDLVGGQIDMMIDGAGTSMPRVRGAQIRALAIMPAQRSALAPEVPTLTETVAPGYSYSEFLGVVAPAGVPVAIQNRLAQEISAGLRTAEVRERLTGLFMEANGNTPEQFGMRLKHDFENYVRLAKELGLKGG